MVALPRHHSHRTEPHTACANRPTSMEVFSIRCWARSRLWAEGELSLHDAVDALQEFAERTGVVALIGQDAVQALMAAEFGACRC